MRQPTRRSRPRRLTGAGFALAAMAGLPAAAWAQPVEPASVASLRAGAAKGLGLERARLVHVTVALTPAGVAGNAATTGSLALELAPGSVTTFTLEPYALRTPGCRLIVSGDGGVETEFPLPPATTFRAVSPAGDEAFVSVDGPAVRGVVRTAAGAELWLQPAADGAGDAAAPTLHAVYARADVAPTGHACGVDGCAVCHGPVTDVPDLQPRGPGTPCRWVEMTAEADYPLFTQSGFSLAATVRDIDAVMLAVNTQYAAATLSVDPRYTINRYVVRASAASGPYASQPLVDADPGAMLGTLASLYPAGAGRDLTHLFTGRDLAGLTVGLAYVSAVCTGSAAGLSQTRFTSNLLSRASVTAHEIGHNWGLQHDDAPGFLMSPAVNAALAADAPFSPASVASFNAQVGSYGCVTGAVPDVQADAAATLPGRPVRIDVLANDGRAGVACPTAVTSFTLPSGATALGGTVAVSAGTGPGGRAEVLYTPPASAQPGALDTFTYAAAGAAVPVSVQIETPRPADGAQGSGAGLTCTWLDMRPNGQAGSYYVFPSWPPNYQTFVFATLAPFTLGGVNWPTSNPTGMLTGYGSVIDGFIAVPTTDYWTFSVAPGSCGQLAIGGDVLVSAGGGVEASGTRALAAGLHAVRINHHAGPSGRLVVSYASSTQAKTPVPAAALFRAVAAPPACVGDFNGRNGVELTDIFDFLGAWFAGCTAPGPAAPCIRSADITGQNGVDLLDIFAFLDRWFAGC